MDTTTFRLLPFLLLFSLSTSLSAQVWHYAYGGTQVDAAYHLAELGNGRYVVGGQTESFSNGEIESMVMLIDEDGQLQWAKYSGTSNSDEEAQGIAVLNGEIYLAGYTDDPGPGSSNGFFQKYDSLGNVQYTFTAGISLVENYTDLDPSPVSGSVYATGFSFQGGIDFFVSRYRPDGTAIWHRTIGNPTTAELSFNGTATSDGGILVYGATSQGAGSDDLIFVKLDSNGTIEWSQLYGTNSTDFPNDVIETSDGYVATGRTNFTGSNEMFLMKMDTGGTLVWANYYPAPGSDDGRSLVQDGNDFIVVGQTGSFGLGSTDGFLAKFDSVGQPIWARTYGNTGGEVLLDVILPSTGGIMAAGSSDSYGAGADEIYVIRTDANGAAGCDDSTFTWTATNLMWVANTPAAIISVAQGTTLPKTWAVSNATFARDTVCPPPPCTLTATFTPNDSAFCLGDTLTAFNTTTSANSLTWLENGVPVGSTGNISLPQDTAGNYVLSLAVSDGSCDDTTDFAFEVYPEAFLQQNGSLFCVGDTFQAINITQGATGGSWFVNGNLISVGLALSLTTTQAGNFSLELLSEPGDCPVSGGFTVEAEPVASFGSVVLGLGADFSDQSTGAQNYLWDFGDGNTSTLQNPSHTYANFGIYTVCLTVTNSAGCTDSTCATIDVLVGLEGQVLSGFMAYPNPFENSLKVQLPEGIQAATLTLMDPKGAEWKHWYVLGNQEKELDLAELPAGVYFLRLEADGSRRMIKAIKY